MREQGQQKGEVSPFLAELQRLEEQAKQQGLGRWSKVRLKTSESVLLHFVSFIQFFFGI